ncbi:MAG: hypothetical protein EAZ87_00460 [Nostocales cyanobacterium]|nr:MAG: hypothetical protein EAZ87_00460 [Nostocales cyanobacterium]
MIHNLLPNNIIRKINQELSISGQITIEQLEKLVDDGYKSIINLCFTNDLSFCPEEEEKVKSLGLYYVNLPTRIDTLNLSAADQVFQIIRELPKPILIHCDNCKRSAAIVLLYIANKQGINFDQVWQQVISLELS